MCANAGHKQEVPRGNATDVLKHASLRGSDDVHHPLVVGPLLRLPEDALKEAFAVGRSCELEVRRAFIRRQGEQHDPLAVVTEERRDAVFAHVGRNGEGVHVGLLEEGASVERRCIADVAAFGVGDQERVRMMLAEVANGLLEGQPAACAGALVEGEVGFIRNGVFGRGVDDGSVESEDGVVVIQQMRRDLLQIRVKPDAEEGFLAADVLDEFVLIHVAMSF